MSEIEESAALPEPPGGSESAALNPDELPPVQPPSAGFIVQLFLIPAIIVAAVIGVWVLFGKLAGAEQDWTQLVQDLGSENEHRRWRAASGLAHMLSADAKRFENIQSLPAEEQARLKTQVPLAENPKVATELVRLFNSQLDKKSTKEKLITHQDFLARTLGRMDLPETVLPALQRAVAGDFDTTVRATSLRSIALVVSRSSRGAEYDSAALVKTLIDSASDTNPLIRQLSAYTLGVTGEDTAREHLVVMLSDADDKVRLNAAIGLARDRRVDGFGVFLDVLEFGTEKLDPAGLERMTDEKRMALLNRFRVEQPFMLKNTIKAIGDLAPGLSDEQKSKAVDGLKPIASDYENVELRKRAKDLMDKLQ